MATIAERHGLPGADRRPYGSGSDVVWGVGDSHVIKLTTPLWLEQIRGEARILERTAGRLSLATPALVVEGVLEGWPYLVMTQLPGRALARVWPAATSGQREGLAEQIGGLLAELAAIGDLELPAESWDEFIDARRGRYAADLAARGANEAWVAALEANMAAVGDPFAREAEHCLLHTELLGEHIFVEPDGDDWRVSALIDLADARVGHPDYDIAALVEFVFKGEGDLLRRCLGAAGREPGDHTPERFLAAANLHRYAHFGRLATAAGIDPQESPDVGRLARALFG